MQSPIATINRHHYKDGLPADAVYVGRGTPLGNPYRIEDQCDADGLPLPKEEARSIAIKRYKLDLWRQIQSFGTEPDTQLPIEAWPELANLAQRVYRGESLQLACNCKPRDCHADVIKAAIEFLLKDYDKWVKPFLPEPEPIKPVIKVGDLVEWKECPPVNKVFSVGMVRSVSEDGLTLRMGFIYHPICIKDCELLEVKAIDHPLWRQYKFTS